MFTRLIVFGLFFTFMIAGAFAASPGKVLPKVAVDTDCFKCNPKNCKGVPGLASDCMRICTSPAVRSDIEKNCAHFASHPEDVTGTEENKEKLAKEAAKDEADRQERVRRKQEEDAKKPKTPVKLPERTVSPKTILDATRWPDSAQQLVQWYIAKLKTTSGKDDKIDLANDAIDFLALGTATDREGVKTQPIKKYGITTKRPFHPNEECEYYTLLRDALIVIKGPKLETLKLRLKGYYDANVPLRDHIGVLRDFSTKFAQLTLWVRQVCFMAPDDEGDTSDDGQDDPFD